MGEATYDRAYTCNHRQKTFRDLCQVIQEPICYNCDDCEEEKMLYDKLLLVDLNRGSYTKIRIGHELFNFDKNSLDGRYYGYVPPRDGVGIKALDPSAKDFVDGVLVVYTQAVSEIDTNREIIGFCTNARVFNKPQSGVHLNRRFKDSTGKWETAVYHIVSNSITDLRLSPDKFLIETHKYNPYMLRKQRSFLTDPKYRELRQNIITYVENYSKIDRDLGEEQSFIQEAQASNAVSSSAYSVTPDEYITSSTGQIVKKNPSISKRVLERNNYRCLCNNSHTTFTTKGGKPYMEGHHLIPCTVSNSQRIQVEFGSKIDREENIVCICPNCHRAIHFGDDTTRRKVIKTIFDKQETILKSAGINIDFDSLIEMYGIFDNS